MNVPATVERIRALLAQRGDLRQKVYATADHRMAGHCYVASEALFHATGAAARWIVCRMRVGTCTHWFLKDRASGEIVDPTADQFDFELDYSKATHTGFLTKRPSLRAQVVLEEIIKNPVAE